MQVTRAFVAVAPVAAPAPAEPVLRLDRVSKTYRVGTAEVRALRNVTVSIPPRCFAMVIGRSGSGKTTLLNLIGCLDKPTSGTVEVCGQDVARLGDTAVSGFRARHLGFVFQNFNLIPVLSAYENVEYPLLLTRAPAAARRRATLDMLDAVGLAHRRAQRPGQLSGGERQRVAIARALVHRPKLVLADEPTANLDSATGATIIQLMRDIQDSVDASFVFSTHDPELMGEADATFVMHDGELTPASVAEVRP